MAIFYPSIETIKKFKVPPTDGERALLNFLYSTLDDSFEVYFNPYLNGDRPDVLIMRKGHGVMIIEVKDWNLDNFRLDEKKKWVYKPNESVVKSPIDQVLRYKNNLYDLHVPELLEMKIMDIRKFNIVACAVYFHCASQDSLKAKLITPYKDERRYLDFLKHNIDFIGNDGLSKDSFTTILKKRYLLADKPSWLFTDEIYSNFKRILTPPVHLKSQGESYSYKDKQREIIYSTTLEQRVKGVFGSGKTTVLAARAVQAYKRALSWTSTPRILILTYNITLKNFIHDKLNRVDEDFPFDCFTIINYHQFINAELNNLNIEFEIPEDLSADEVSVYLNNNYYSNIRLFDENKEKIVKYDAVLIDEIQDYQRPWMDIVKNYFRESKGDYVLFGDVKQNIYGQPTENKDVSTNVSGRPKELNYCFRSDFKVRDLAHSFQKNIFGEKYDVDDFSENGTYNFFGHEEEKEGQISYRFLEGKNLIATLYDIIRGNILNDSFNIAPNDITILASTTGMLRMFDAYYRYSSREKTSSMVETIEAMYMTNLNYIGKDTESNHNPHYVWFQNISEHFKKKLFPNRTQLYDNDIIKLRQRIAVLFTLYDLFKIFRETFKARLDEECHKCGISLEAFLAFREHYSSLLETFKTEVYNHDYKVIRDNKKLNFWMNSGKIKISTIHSFKGWESEVVFLIIEPNSVSMTYDEIIYTGITRCKRNLVVINFGNREYDAKISPLIKAIK